MHKPTTRRKILLVHHVDSYSGSPHVLAQVVKLATARGFECTVLTTPGGGFLADLDGVRHWWLRSRFGKPTRLPSSVAFLLLQLEECAYLVRARAEGIRAVYLNTLYHPLPALLSRLLFPHRVVHAHEVPRPLWVGKILARIASLGAQQVFHPTRYAMETLGVSGNPRNIVVPCGVEEIPDPSDAVSRFRLPKVVSAASLAVYKGAREFVELARSMPDLSFRLALGASREDSLRTLGELPPNLELLCQCRDRVRIFGDASVVVCATLPRLRAENFAVSVAEAMAWGIPVVVPPVGGMVERVVEGRNGFLVDPEDLGSMASAIRRILSSEETYLSFSREAQKVRCSMRDFETPVEEFLSLV
jgi:L-malate glycosyltransferase